MATFKASITVNENRTFLHFYNSKAVYDMEGFDTERKARNYAKRLNVELVDKLPEHIDVETYAMSR